MSKRELLWRLDRPGGRWALSRVLTLNNRRHGRPQSYRWSGGRWWIDHPDGSVLKGTGDPSAWHEDALDYFCWRYTPAPGDFVVDLGAGVGTELLTWAELVGDGGLVAAYEAHPATFAKMEALVGRNQLSMVSCLPYAIFERSGSVIISDFEDHISNSIVGVEEGSGWEAEAVTLDEAYQSWPRSIVDFMKVNVEGAESYVISHGQETLAHTRHVAVSCHDHVADRTGVEPMRTKAAVQEALLGLGFDLTSRPDDPRPWVPGYLYGENRRLSSRLRD